MKHYRNILTCLLVTMSLSAQAQQEAIKALADGHYEAAKQQFAHFIDNARGEDTRLADAQGLLLVCDYVLDTPSTVDNMQVWVAENPVSPYSDAIRVLHRNLLIKTQRYDEAIDLFLSQEGDIISTPLPYPLTRISDEMSSYNEVMYRLVGEHLYDKGELKQALKYLEAGEKTRASLYKLGMCYYQQGAFEKAASSLAQSATDQRDAMAQNAWLHAGIAHLQLIRKAEAQDAFLKASQMDADKDLREMALYNYALTLHEKADSKTVAVMEQFLNEFPTSPYATPVSQCLTEAYMSKKDYSKALNAISKVQTPNADSQADKQKVLYNLAFEALNANKIDKALAYAGDAVALGNLNAESYAESYYIKGDCNYRLGNYAIAANDLRTAINLGTQTSLGHLKNNTYAVYSLGYALFKLQRYNAAISQFDKIVQADDASSAMKADALNRLGDSYLNMRDYDKANQAYSQAKATDHTLGDYSMLQQAYIEGLLGNYDRKIEIINSMKTEYANSSLSAKALFEQGRAYVLSGRTDEANALFQSIIIKHPGSEYAKKASEEIANMAANIAIQDSIAAAQDSIETEAAKAPVLAAQELYDGGQYQIAEQQILAAIDKGIARPYWLARAFILLSDIYKAEGRTIEAKQTLESLKANYKDEDDIQEMINQRLQ